MDETLPLFKQWKIAMYDKVGAYYSWSLQEFEDTSIMEIDALSNLIDSKIKPYVPEESDGEEGKAPFSYLHLSILLALSALFGKKDTESGGVPWENMD